MKSQKLFLRSPEPCRILTFSPLAWLKLQFFCHAGDTEIGGFGISAQKDLLYVEDFVTVRQRTSFVTVGFDDSAVADWFDRCVDQGLAPARFARIWLHTHPGTSVTPSGLDEETFVRVFGCCDWSVMFILGRGGQTYARLAFSAGPGGELPLAVQVDWSSWPDVLAGQSGTLQRQVEQWQQEYEANIQVHSTQAVLPMDVRFWERDWLELEERSPKLEESFQYQRDKDIDHEFVF